MSSKPGSNDPINPNHYKAKWGDLQVADVAEMFGLDKDAWLTFALKYILRAGKKRKAPMIQDLEKAIWYIERRIQCLKK